MSEDETNKKIDDFIAHTCALTGQVVFERAFWNTTATADAIRHFCYGIGDDNPLWLDPGYAGKSHYGRLVAPPTFLTSVLYPILHGAPVDVPMSSLVAELEFRWFHPVIEGDRLRASSRQKTAFESKNRRSRRTVYIISETDYWNHRDELVAQAIGTMMRLCRTDGEMLLDRPVYRYSQEELERIALALRQESRTGDRDFFAEEVAVGYELPPLTRGPLTIGDMVCWQAATGPPYRAGPLGYFDGLRAPYTMVKNPLTGWEVKYSQQHEDLHLAVQRGMPAPFDNGVMRFAWISPLLTNWVGDAGTLKRLSLQIVAPNLYGDTAFYQGKVTNKTEAEDSAEVGVEITGINQLGTITTKGYANVLLPYRTANESRKVRKIDWKTSILKPDTEETCIHELFNRQARSRFSEVALIFRNQQVTYEELNGHADRLACHLHSLGVRPDTLVGLCMDRSLELVIGLLAILKAGGAYVPLDPEYPKERLSFMLEDAALPFVLTHKALLHKLPKHGAKVICVNRETTFFEGDDTAICSNFRIKGDNLAYVMYTSGTTELPKGVVVPHSSLSIYIQSIGRALPVTEHDVFLQTASISFSAAVRQILLPLYTGSKIVMADWEETKNTLALLELIKRCRVTVWDTIPSIWNSCVRALNQLDRESIASLLENDLRLILVTGEPLTWEVVRTWRVGLGHGADVINLYSQTETTGTACCFKVPIEIGTQTGVVPLGRPIDNTGLHVLDENLQPVADSNAGELCVSGPRLAKGYWDKPVLTSQRFVPNPFGSIEGDRLYRTKDLGRRLSDGTFEYLGRLDDQIKIRGFRIAPAEVEGALAQYPKVKEVAVRASKELSGEKKLLAYVVPTESHAFTVDGRPRHRLPNNLAIIHLNRHETEFSYRAIFENQTYLKHGITIGHGACVFDVGANIGLFALFVNLLCKAPSVYCFEPNPPVFSILRANVRLYAPDTKLFPFGLSDQEKITNFTSFAGSSLQSGFYAEPEREKEVLRQVIFNQRDAGVEYMDEIAQATDYILDHRFSYETIKVQLKTLSGMIAQNDIERIDLLKINVEKSELYLLLGIRDADWSKIEQLVIKVDLPEHLDPILALLDSHGYETAVGQDRLLQGTPINTVYAIRPSASRRLKTGDQAGQQRRPLPVLGEPFLSADELREFLSTKLPQYMVPSKFIFVERLARTPSGKLDRQALSMLNKSDRRDRPSSAKPSVGIEKELARIWLKLLDIVQIDINDNFFEMGGDSLQVAMLIAAMREKYQVQMSFRTFFERPTIAGLVSIIEGTLKEGADPDKRHEEKDLKDKLKKLERGF